MINLFDIYIRIKNNKTVINGGLYSLYSFIGKGVSFILMIILAKYILPVEYGYLSLFSTASTLLGFFMGFSSFGYLTISYFKKTKDDFKKDFSAIISLYLFTSIIFSIILIMAGDFLVDKSHLSFQLLWYVIIISLFNCFFFINQDLFRIKEKIIGYGIFSCGNALINFVLSIVFVIYLQQNWMGRINAQLICTVFFGIVGLCYFIKCDYFDFRLSWDRYKTILLWSLPIIPHLATNWIRQGCDRYIIDYHYSVYEVGVFSFALTLISVFNTIGYAFNSTNSVSLYKLLSNKDDPNVAYKLSRLTKQIFWTYTGACVFLTIFFPIIVVAFLPKYTPSLGYFFVLSIFGYLECLYYIYINYLFYYGKTKMIMYMTLGTSLLHLFLSLFLTQYSLYYTAFIYILIDAILLFLIRRQAILLRIENNII